MKRGSTHLGLVALLVLAACGSTSDEATGAVASAIIGGKATDASQNGVVLVMHYDALQSAGATGCSGALIAPNLVLTARHCVSVTDETSTCTAQGKAAFGGKVYADEDPTKLFVFGGVERPDFLSGAVHPSFGTQILTTGAMTICNEDIALIVLDRPVVGATTMPVRLAGGPAANEVVTLVGWGITETSESPKTRQQRAGVPIIALGPSTSGQLGPAEFATSEGTCAGDSGGPAISASGAVVGVVSRGVIVVADAGAGGPSCVGGTSTFTSTAAYADLLATAYAKAGQVPWAEGQPDPLLATADVYALGGGCAVGPTPKFAFPFGLVGLCAVAVVFLARRKCRIGSEGWNIHPEKNDPG